MKHLQQQAVPLDPDLSILAELDDADIEDILGLPEWNLPAAEGVIRAQRAPRAKAGRKVWLFNAGWIALCLVILTGALLFALHMLAKGAA